MKVKIGKYTTWFGPYQLAELLCFWVKPVKSEYDFESKPHWVHEFGEWLAHGSVKPNPKVGEITSWDRDRPNTWLHNLLIWIESKKKRKIEVRIDPWDTWSADHTLSYIILPVLKQLKATKHGSPFVDDEDVPEHLRSTAAPAKENEWDTDENHFLRWDWAMGEMIFAFECKMDDSWEDQFRSGVHDLQWKQLEKGMSQMIDGPNNTYQCDYEGMKVMETRIQNGFRLFGKYYQALWD